MKNYSSGVYRCSNIIKENPEKYFENIEALKNDADVSDRNLMLVSANNRCNDPEIFYVRRASGDECCRVSEICLAKCWLAISIFLCFSFCVIPVGIAICKRLF